MVVSYIDFFEKYTMRIQNEIQNMHWHNFQVNILVHITYHRNPGHDGTDLDSPLLKEIHYYVSNDTSHDSLFVQHAFMLH
jgi:hypothetical protein